MKSDANLRIVPLSCLHNRNILKFCTQLPLGIGGGIELEFTIEMDWNGMRNNALILICLDGGLQLFAMMKTRLCACLSEDHYLFYNDGRKGNTEKKMTRW